MLKKFERARNRKQLSDKLLKEAGKKKAAHGSENCGCDLDTKLRELLVCGWGFTPSYIVL